MTKTSLVAQPELEKVVPNIQISSSCATFAIVAEIPKTDNSAAPVTYNPDSYYRCLAGTKRKADDYDDKPDKRVRSSSPAPTSLTAHTPHRNFPAAIALPIAAATSPLQHEEHVTASVSSSSSQQGIDDNNTEGNEVDLLACRATKKVKTIDQLRQEAYDAVKDEKGNACYIAMANYNIERVNRAGKEWAVLEKRRQNIEWQQIAKIDFQGMRKKAFDQEMNRRIKAAKRAYNKLRWVGRAKFDKAAVAAAKRELEVAQQVKALGHQWEPPAFPEPEIGRKRGASNQEKGEEVAKDGTCINVETASHTD